MPSNKVNHSILRAQSKRAILCRRSTGYRAAPGTRVVCTVVHGRPVPHARWFVRVIFRVRHLRIRCMDRSLPLLDLPL